MNYSKFRITLDIHKHQSQVSIPVMYGDTAVQLYVTLSDGGMPYAIGKSCWAQFVAKKPDNSEPLLRKCIIENGTVIRLDFDDGIADVAGVYDCEIRLYGAEGKITSPCFTMVVDPRVAADYIGDDAENNFIDQIGTTMAEFQRAEEARETAEAAREDAEAERKANENERKAAERLRGLAEGERVEGEDARKAAETARESAESERIRILNEINKRLPVPGANDHGKYLRVDGNKWVVSDVPFIAPRLYAPVITSIDSRGKSVTFEPNESNGDFGTKYKVYIDGEPVITTEVKSADFSDYVGDKITCTVGVVASGDGFLDSSASEGRWGLTNGDMDNVTTSREDSGALVASVSLPPFARRTVPTIINGESVFEVILSPRDIITTGTLVYELNFPDSVSVLTIENTLKIGMMYIPNVEAAFIGNKCEIERIYSYDTLPAEVLSSVKELSGNTANGFKRINTWCIGVGRDRGYEYAIKEDGTARLTYDDTYYGDYYEEVIPNTLGDLPVNGIGKFYKYLDNYLTGVTFSDNIEDINDSAFRNCSAVTFLKFGKGLKSIGEHAFRYSGVTSLDFSGCPNLETIKGRAFSNCSKLASVKMSSSVNTIGSTAFASCSALKDIYVPWGEGEVAGAPWGATGATIHYNSEV